MVRPATAIATVALGLALLVPPPSADAALALFPVSNGTFNLTLDGTDRAPTYTFRLVMSNPSPYDNGGYHLTIAAPNLSDGASHTLPAGVIQSVAATCFSNCAGAPANSVPYPLTIPSGAPVTFFNAAAGTSLGNYNVIPTVRVDVPANTHAGTYTTTITTALVTGP
jgi:hypothetical protein